MASSGNFPLWSPLIKGATNLSKGNTRFDGSTNNRSAMTSFAVPTGTKFYVECLVKHATNYNIVFGLANPDVNLASNIESDSSMNGVLFAGYNSSNWYLNPLTNGSRGGFSSNVGLTSARVLAMTVNRVDNEIKMYLDNSLKYTISISATEVYHIVCSFAGGTASTVHMNINCGHDSTGAGDFSSGSATDENGFGEFQYQPPASFLAPSSANLPISDDIDPAQTDDNFPQKLFNAITWTGNRVNNSTVNNITGVGFTPDLVWLRFREQTYDWRLVDSSRGVTKIVRSNQTTAEQTEANGIYQFDSDGFSVKGDNNYNYNGGAFIGYCWRANGGNVSSNSDGSITSSVQTSPAKNFSIITYSGNGINSTFGHGMTKKPAFIIIKNLNDSDQWAIYHESMTADFYTSFTGSIFSNNATFWNDTEPTTSVISIGTNNRVNGSGDNFVCYAWTQVEGMQKFSTYQGTGDSDGITIYLGFRPRMIFIKKNANSSDFHNFDTARNTFNPVNTFVSWDSTTADDTASSNSIDFLSQGFKLRNNASGLNASGSTYVFGAWGDQSAKYSNAF